MRYKLDKIEEKNGGMEKRETLHALVKVGLVAIKDT